MTFFFDPPHRCFGFEVVNDLACHTRLHVRNDSDHLVVGQGGPRGDHYQASLLGAPLEINPVIVLIQPADFLEVLSARFRRHHALGPVEELLQQAVDQHCAKRGSNPRVLCRVGDLGSPLFRHHHQVG